MRNRREHVLLHPLTVEQDALLVAARTEVADTPAVLTELKLTDQVKDLVDKALDRGKPLVIAYVAEDGKPSISFRGSTQVYISTQLAIWVRNAKSGLATAIGNNPNVLLFYSNDILNPAVRAMRRRSRGRRRDCPCRRHRRPVHRY